jgi:DNA-binding XRE family transcriptional regulator
MQSKGGEARREALTAAQRSEIASVAAVTRWSKRPPMKPVEDIYVLIGQRIRHQREMNGQTQEQLAAFVKMSRPSIINIEQGKQRITLHDLQAFSQALRLPMSRFLKGILL